MYIYNIRKPRIVKKYILYYKGGGEDEELYDWNE